MVMKINDEEVVDRYEIWSVKFKSTDGEVNEIAFPEGEAEARRYQKAFGGQLWKRHGYATAGGPVEQMSDEETLDLV